MLVYNMHDEISTAPNANCCTDTSALCPACAGQATGQPVFNELDVLGLPQYQSMIEAEHKEAEKKKATPPSKQKELVLNSQGYDEDDILGLPPSLSTEN